MHTDVLGDCEVLHQHVATNLSAHLQMSISVPDVPITPFLILMEAMHGANGSSVRPQIRRGQDYVLALDLCDTLDCNGVVYNVIVECLQAHLEAYKEWDLMPADAHDDPVLVARIWDINTTYVAYKEHIRWHKPAPFSRHSFANLIWQGWSSMDLINYGDYLHYDIYLVVKVIWDLQRELDWNPLQTFTKSSKATEFEIDSWIRFNNVLNPRQSWYLTESLEGPALV